MLSAAQTASDPAAPLGRFGRCFLLDSVLNLSLSGARLHGSRDAGSLQLRRLPTHSQ